MTQPKIEHLEAVRPESIVQTTVDGVPAYAFTLRDGDVQSWDKGNIGPSGKPNQRAEISYEVAPSSQKGKSPYDVTDKTGKRTYDIDYRFKAGWPKDQRWAVLTQFHPQDDNPSGFHGFGGVTVHGNEITLDNPNGDGGYFARIPIRTDAWFQFRLVVNWSSKADGFVKLVSRATGAVLGRYDGPTIAAGEFKYLKQGYYRDGGITAEGTVYETLMDISEGDLSAVVVPPAPAPTPTPSVMSPEQKAAWLAMLQETRDGLWAGATTMQTQGDKIQALLDKGDRGPW
jgi:hypothetical protein